MQQVSDQRYSGLQIALHWAIVLLVVVQWLSHEAMEEFWDDAPRASAPGLPDQPIPLLHALSGAAILILMLARVAARLRYGAPPAPADLRPALQLLARLNHYAFYLVLIALPLTGATAIFLGIEDSADLHKLLVPALFTLIGLHLAGAIYHTVVLRDGLIWRMLKPR